jgi:phage major head subunit gpT-like protein
MQINQSNLSALFKGYRTFFLEAYQGAKTTWDQIALRTPSTAAVEIYHWLGSVPGMRELVGDVAIQNLSASNYSISNKEFESTVAVKQSDIERDTYGIYNPLMESMGLAARQHQDQLVAGLLINGFDTLDYTGKNFFDTNKKHEPGNSKSTLFSNKLTGALTPENFSAARALIKGRTNAAGRPMGLGIKLQLIVPPALESEARQILQADFIQQTASNAGTIAAAAAVSNVNKGTAELIVWPQLAGSDTSWFLLETAFPVRPLILQVEKEPTFESLTNPDSDHVFKRHEFLYQSYGRYNAGYGLPQLAVGSTGEG